jgi:hypothetical protein
VEPLILGASVLIGLRDTRTATTTEPSTIDRPHRADHQLLAPASAYSEALIAFARAGRVKDARDAVAGMGITVVPLTASIAERAVDLRADHDALRLPDALVLATAHAHDGSLITYDHRRSDCSSASQGLTRRPRSASGHGGDGRCQDARSLAVSVDAGWQRPRQRDDRTRQRSVGGTGHEIAIGRL